MWCTVQALIVCVFLIEPGAGSSAEANISSEKLSNEGFTTEPFVVYLLISFKEIHSACPCP